MKIAKAKTLENACVQQHASTRIVVWDTFSGAQKQKRARKRRKTKNKKKKTKKKNNKHIAKMKLESE